MSGLTFYSPCIILCICLLYNFTTIPAVTCSSNQTDFQALVAFKNAIDHDPEGALRSWNETVHFCSWPGIFCGQKHRSRVVEIDLMSRGLVGTISPHLGNLSFLRSITLQNNSFHGPIPQEFGRLRRLEYIEFSNNTLSGEITRNLSNCVNIYYLNLIDNDLTGVIPPELSSLVKLQALGLTYNRISGTIPHFLGNFTSLKKLSLTDCGLQGEIPESLVQLKSLKFLKLAVNNLTGVLPSGLFNMSNMENFDMSENRLQGTIPSHLGFSSSRLTWLKLTYNSFHGDIPISLSNFSLLKILDLGSNSFSGEVMIDFYRLSALEYFFADRNYLKGDISFISSMINCTRLHFVDTSFNLLSGLLPYSIANLSNIFTSFILNGNQFHGSIPYGLGNLVNLNLLSLSNNHLTGPIPADIGKLNKLQLLELNGNTLTNDIPILFNNLTMLSHLNLSQNNLSGNIPPSLSNCSNLLTLDMSHNNLNGELPGGAVSMLSLITLDMSYNALTGSIPPEVGRLGNLVSLSLSHNKLSGLLPNTLSRCVGLERIYLQSNSFSREVFEELRNLRSLQYLDLSQNNLSGTIPSSLGGLKYLVYLNLSFNKLEGEIPNIGVYLNETALILEGNNELCGGIPSLRFPSCSSQKSKKKHFPIVFKILIPVVSTIAMVSLIYCIFLYNRRKLEDTQSSIVPVKTNHLRLSYGDLLKSTSGFSELNLLGAGRFGSVYKGILENLQTCVAVKVINLNVRGAVKSLMSECSALRGIRHKNLVKIVSVCCSTDFQGNDFKALVYEYMVNGDLDKWLHRNCDDQTGILSLRQRVNIAIDIAHGLEYIHCSTGTTIVHGDLKPSNILLDENMTARVSDFGLAKVISDVFSTNESSSLGIRGTIGYIPPEYGLSGMVSAEGDVYSYGIILLEMFTGRRPTTDEPNDSPSLRDLVGSALQRQVLNVVDPVILQECDYRVDDKTLNCIALVLEIGLACSNELPKDRMLMHNVVSELRKVIHIVE